MIWVKIVLAVLMTVFLEPVQPVVMVFVRQVTEKTASRVQKIVQGNRTENLREDIVAETVMVRIHYRAAIHHAVVVQIFLLLLHVVEMVVAAGKKIVIIVK